MKKLHKHSKNWKGGVLIKLGRWWFRCVSRAHLMETLIL